MTCQRCGDPMYVFASAPEFVIWSCVFNAHHVRVGAPPPAPPRELPMPQAEPVKSLDLCVNHNCYRPRWQQYARCLKCFESHKRAQHKYQAKKKKARLSDGLLVLA